MCVYYLCLLGKKKYSQWMNPWMNEWKEQRGVIFENETKRNEERNGKKNIYKKFILIGSLTVSSHSSLLLLLLLSNRMEGCRVRDRGIENNEWMKKKILKRYVRNFENCQPCMMMIRDNHNDEFFFIHQKKKSCTFFSVSQFF